MNLGWVNLIGIILIVVAIWYEKRPRSVSCFIITWNLTKDSSPAENSLFSIPIAGLRIALNEYHIDLFRRPERLININERINARKFIFKPLLQLYQSATSRTRRNNNLSIYKKKRASLITKSCRNYCILHVQYIRPGCRSRGDFLSQKRPKPEADNLRFLLLVS